MIISIKSSIQDAYSVDVTIERHTDDLTASEVLECITEALIASGYHPDSVKDAVIGLADSYEDNDRTPSTT